MNQMKFLIRLFFLFISCYGYLQYLRKSIRLEFCIGVLFSGVGSVMFLAGTLNLLSETAYAIFLGGLVLAVFSVIQKDRITSMLSFGSVFFLVFSVFLLFLLRGSEFIHYDNFSHWALASRIVTLEGRFPNYSDYNVHFPSYPLGSAALIFYITKITNCTSEWMQMYAQAIVILGMLVSLFAFARTPIQSLATAVCAVFLLCGGTHIYDLLVDSLLALTALSAVSALVYYGTDIQKRLWIVMPYALFLVSIKNSGVFFVLILYGFLWFALRKQGIPVKTWLAVLSAPAVLLLLWQKHVQAMFPNGMLAKHSMSVSNYRSVFAGKTLSDIRLIIQALAGKTFTLSNKALWLLLAVLLLCQLWRHNTPPSPKRIPPYSEMSHILILAVVSYALYQIGTLGMYLFSMPLSEALRLASYDRYHKTVVLFLAGLLLIALMQGLERMPSSRRPLQLACLTGVVALSCLVIRPDFSSLQKQQLEGTDRGRMDQLIAQYEIAPGKKYLILVSEDRDDSGYLSYMTRYLLCSEDLTIQSASALDSVEPSDYDYIIVFEETRETNELVFALSGNADPVVCLF